MNKKIVENSNEPDQYLSELQIYPGFAQNSESESPEERSKRINSEVHFSVVRNPNIL